VLSFYDVADFKQNIHNGHHPHISALNDLLQFFRMQKRQDEAFDLFTKYLAAAKGNTVVLSSLYFYGARALDENRFKELEPDLAEDLRHVFGELKTDFKKHPASGIGMLFDYWDTALRAGIMDFKNDSGDWTVLARTDTQHTGILKSRVGSLLFPKADKNFIKGLNPNMRPHSFPPQKQETDAEMLRSLKDAVENGVFSDWQISAFGEIMRFADDRENSNWFYLGAIRQSKEDYYKTQCHMGLISNYLAAGDWENGEKHIGLAIGLRPENADSFSRTIISRSLQAAELAEKSGAPEAAERMRARIENLGVFP